MRPHVDAHARFTVLRPVRSRRACCLRALLTLLMALGILGPLRADTVTLLDVFSGTGQHGSSPKGFTNMGGTTYFFADPDVADENVSLYKTDGTLAGTALVKDLPGQAGHDVVVAGGNTLYFIVGNGSLNQLWKSDGTAGNTTLVKDLSTVGSAGATVRHLVGATSSQRIYFNFSDDTNGEEIWTSDGTGAETEMITDLTPGTGATSLNPLGDNDENGPSFRVLGNVLLFAHDNGVHGAELWKTDGTTTVMVKDIDPDAGEGSNPDMFVHFNGQVYFVVFMLDSNGYKVWKTDGTTGGTTVFGTYSGFADQFGGLCPVGNTLYLIGPGSTSPETSLWKIDTAGVPTEVKVLSDFGPAQAFPMWAAGTRLFFGYDGDNYIGELWTSDGTTVGTAMIKQLHAGQSGSSFDGENVAIGNTTYFIASGWDDTITSIFRSNGTAAGTVSVFDDHDEGQLGDTRNMFMATALATNGSKVLFAGTDLAAGTELWTVNGAPAAMLVNLNTQPVANSGSPEGIVPFGTGVLLSLTNAANGDELWKSNGTVAGTTLVKDIRTGVRGSFTWPIGGSAVGTKFILEANDGVNGSEPWVTDGTTAGTLLLKNTAPGKLSGELYSQALVGSTLYFQNWFGELWKSTGTGAGTSQVILPDDILYFGDGNMGSAGGLLFFSAEVDNPGVDQFGEELVKSNGTTAGTVMVKDINPDPLAGSFPSDFTAVGSTLFFYADDGMNGRELWKSDGSAAGTVLVKNINPGGDSNGTVFEDAGDFTRINLGGTLFFVADDGTNGGELWKSNGTEAGTVMVMNINPTDHSNPHRFTVVAGTLYFLANDGTNGEELWKTDGTTTVMVKNINPGPAGSIGYFTGQWAAPLNGLLYFAADDGSGMELWRTNGTEAGTVKVTTLSSGMNAAVSEVVASNGRIFFGADTTANGYELYSLTPSPEIVVNQGVGGTSLTDGSAMPVDFGNVPINSNAPITFEIVNTGTSNLTGLVVTKTGTHMANYTVGALGATTLVPGASTTFTVTLNTPAVGTRTAALVIASNDADENPYNINLTANGTAPGGVLAFGGTLFQVNETDGSVNIPIIRTGGTGTVGVTVTTTNGTATAAGGDYVAYNNITNPVSITEGNNGTAMITINNLGGDELHETFTVTLSSPTNGSVLGTPVTATVRIIDSVDNTAPPAPTFSATPAAGALIGVNTGASFNVTGTATDGKGVQFVEYRVTTPGGTPSAFTPAVLSAPGAASTGWAATITPVTGNNTIEVRTRDFKPGSPNTSPVATRTFKFIRPLLVNVSGVGSVTPAGYVPNSFREVGKPHTITATAGTGALFSGWTVLSGHTNTQLGTNATALEKATLTFIHRENLSLRANFVTNPYTTNVVGTFNGAIKPSTTLPNPPGSTASGLSTEGYITMLVQGTGGFSGSMKIDGMTLGVAGTFDHNGVARFGTSRANTLSVARAEKPSLAVSLNINTGTGKIMGNIWQLEGGTIVAVSNVDADRAFFSATNPVPTTAFNATVGRPAAGTYTMLFEPDSGGALGTGQFPQGYGHGTVTVSTAGAITVAGTLADKTAVSMSTTLSQAGTWRLFVQLYTGMQGFIAGNVTTDHAEAESDFQAPDTRWICPILDRQHYPLGWTEGITVDTFGSKYTVTAGASVLPLNQATGTGDGNAALQLTNGLLSPQIDKNLDINIADIVTEVPVDPSYTLGINRTTGVVSGSFLHSDGTTVNYTSVIFQKLPGAYGYFQTTTPAVKTYTGESGQVSLTPQ